MTPSDFATIVGDLLRQNPALGATALKIDITVNFVSTEITAKLDQVLAALSQLNQKEQTMSVELDALTAEVAAMKTVEESAVALINGLAAQLAAAKTDPVAIQALADSLKATSADLAAAVSANTPVVPPVTPAP